MVPVLRRLKKAISSYSTLWNEIGSTMIKKRINVPTGHADNA
jgi:hypothetical protein